MLTGSDYTDGIESVGPVTAMEILAEFPADSAMESLRSFKSWSENATTAAAAPGTKAREKLRRFKLPESELSLLLLHLLLLALLLSSISPL